MSLAGRLEDLALADIFQILSIGRKTGTFIVRGTKGTALVVFKNGLIVRAETDDIEETVAETLLKAGIVREAVLDTAHTVKKKLPVQSLSSILLELAAVSRDSLDRVFRKRMAHIVHRLLLWEDGDFQFDLDDLAIENKADLTDLGWELAKGLSPEYLLREGSMVQEELSEASCVPAEVFAIEEGEQKKQETQSEWDDNREAAPESGRRDISALKSLTQELRLPSSTSEITLLVLRFASDIFQRGVLFMARKDRLVGLGQFGNDIERADDRIRGIVLSLEVSPFLKKVVMEQRAYRGPLEQDPVTQHFISEIGGAWPPEAVIFPVIAEGKVVAVLYCDNALSKAPLRETEGLDIFISHAGLALEKALLQRRLQEMEKGRG